MTSTALCHHCGLTFTPKKGSRGKFCSSSCSAKVNNAGRVRTESSKSKTRTAIQSLIQSGQISAPPKLYGADHPRWRGGKRQRQNLSCTACKHPLEGSQKKYCAACVPTRRTSQPRAKKLVNPHKCIMCDNMINTKDKTCSPECRRERNRQAASDNLRKNRHKYVGPTQRSYMERTFVEWLEENGISKGVYGYWDQVHFKHRPEGKVKNGWADFVFVSRRLIIELDGTHHKKRTHLDAVRDAHLSDRRGYKVIRITHAEYTKKMRLQEIERALGI